MSDSSSCDPLVAKRRYHTLDRIVSDSDLTLHLERYGSDKETLLTLGACLIFDLGGLGTKILNALESNLAHFNPHLDRKKRKHVSDNLLNGRDQFLNTLSELGLARRLSDQGRVIHLAHPFHDGNRDVDIADCTPGSEKLIEVVNLAAQEADIHGFAPSFSEETSRLVNTISKKYRKKFGKALDEGWNGPIWIALDIIKNDLVAISAVLGPLTQPDFFERFGSTVFSSCPKLQGIIYYTHYAYNDAAFWVKELYR